MKVDNLRPKQINKIKQSNDGLFIKSTIFGNSVDCLIDTGATTSVLHSKVFLRLPEEKRPQLNRNCGDLRVADGEIIVPMGMATFPLRIDDKIYHCRMIVADIESPAVLGYDFLKDNHCEMHIGKGTILLNGKRIECHLESQKPNTIFRVALTETVVLPAASEMIIPTRVIGDLPIGHNAMVDNGSSVLMKRGIMIGKSLFRPSNEVIPVRVINLSPKPQTIYKNTTTAECVTVRSSQIQESNIDHADDQACIRTGCCCCLLFVG